MASPAPTTYSPFRMDWLPGVLYCVFMLSNAPTGFLLPIFFSEQLHFNGNQIGVLFALQAVTGVLASFPAGLGNDRVTSRSLAAVALALQSVGLILMATVKVYFPYLFVFFFWAIANNLFRTSMDVQVLKTDTGERTGSRLGVYHGGRFVGLALGMIGAGYWLTVLDFEKGLIAVAVLSFLLILVVRRLVPTRIGRTRLADYKADFSNPTVWLFAIWLFLFATHWGPEQTCYGLFLRKNLHLNLVQIGWYMSAEFAAIVVTLILVAKKFNRTDNLFAFTVVGLLGSGIGHVGMVVPIVAVSVIFRTVHGIGDGIIMLVMYVGVARLFNLERLGGNAGLVNLSVMLGSIFGALVAGPLGAAYGYGLPLWASGVVTLTLIAPIVFRQLRRRTA